MKKPDMTSSKDSTKDQRVFPAGVVFDTELRLMVWRPVGILNAKAINTLIQFLEKEEDIAQQPFNRFTDTSKLDALDLEDRFVYRVALHRRRSFAGRPPVKSAFYVTSEASIHYLKIHAIVSEQSPLEVKIFKDLDEAAEWLGVPLAKLEP
jgi:hypothetical protein